MKAPAFEHSFNSCVLFRKLTSVHVHNSGGAPCNVGFGPTPSQAELGARQEAGKEEKTHSAIHLGRLWTEGYKRSQLESPEQQLVHIILKLELCMFMR